MDASGKKGVEEMTDKLDYTVYQYIFYCVKLTKQNWKTNQRLDKIFLTP